LQFSGSPIAACVPKLMMALPTFSLFKIPVFVKKASIDVGTQPF